MEIRKYKQGDENAILDLFKTSFNKEMSLDYWNWRFRDNPIGTEMIYLMWDKSKLVGHYAVSPNILSIEGDICKSALSMTTMTHPDYGGKGIFTKLASDLYNSEHNQGGLDVIWGFPNRLSHRGFIKNLGWDNIAVIPNFSLVSSEYRFKKTSGNTSFSKIEKIENVHVANRNSQLSDYTIKLDKDIEYYNWRYNKNPLNNYLILSNNDNDFVIIKAYDNGAQIELDIIEWCIPNNFNKMKYAINSMLQYFSELNKQVSKFNMWLPFDDERYINFELLGFANREHITFMGYRNMNNAVKTKGLNWFYQMGDSDVY